MVPPGLSICRITARARELAKPFERLDAVLVAADQTLHVDAGDVVAGRHQPAAGHKRDGQADQRDERDQQRADAPEGELAPHAAAIDDGIGIERHWGFVL